MKRFSLWLAALAALFILFYFGLNLFDSKTPPGSVSGLPPGVEKLPAASLETGSGFFLLWGFAEPPETDLLAPAFRDQVLELFATTPNSYLYRTRSSRWLKRLNSSFRQHWQGGNLYFPQLPMEDICAYFASIRSQIAERQERYAVPLERYRRILRMQKLEDFTPLGWDFPRRSYLLVTYSARLFAASRALAALDGQWLPACVDLLDALDAGLKLTGSGRTLTVNLLGKTMVELSLRTLASLLNRSDCPQQIVRFIRERLPARTIEAFGTATARAFTWMSFAQALRRIKQERIIDPFLLKDYFNNPAAFFAVERFIAISGPGLFVGAHALAAFFLKENESSAMMRAFWEKVGVLEKTPPWQWDRAQRRPRLRGVEAAAGPFWWLRNPLGKMMVSASVPYEWPVLQNHVYRSYELKIRYDLTRLLAQARLQAGSAMGLHRAALQELLASATERDPFSGSPYRCNRETGMLYSIGPDRRDDGGREQAAVWRDSDIALPIKFVSRDS